MPRTPIPALASPPIVNLVPRDVEALVEELQAYHAIFSPRVMVGRVSPRNLRKAK
jgi:hypothetical protein